MSVYIKSFLLVLTSGLIWSFGVVAVRYLVDSQDYIFHYLVYRGIATTVIILLFLLFKEGKKLYKIFFKIDVQTILGSFFLAITFTCFIFSITKTTVAVTLCMLAAIPFITGILGYYILGEVVRRSTLIAMMIAFIGITFMIINDYKTGSVMGAFLGLIAACGFSLYTITIRWKPKAPKYMTVAIAGMVCAIFSFALLEFSIDNLLKIPITNIYFSLLHGLIISSGFILYSIGAKHLPSAELTLLTLLEIVGGIIWVWIPIFGINEIPNTSILTGGIIIILAIIYYSLNLKEKL